MRQRAVDQTADLPGLTVLRFSPYCESVERFRGVLHQDAPISTLSFVIWSFKRFISTIWFFKEVQLGNTDATGT
jgi:hypothetical protein